MRLLSIFMLMGLCSLQAPAQTIATDVAGLNLYHRAKRIQTVIAYGTKVTLRDSNGLHRGRLTDNTKTEVFIDGIPFDLKDVLWIGRRSLGSKFKGAGLALLGLGIGFSGPVLVSGGTGNGYVNGILLSAVGGGVIGLSVSQFRNGRRYYLDSDWKVIEPG